MNIGQNRKKLVNIVFIENTIILLKIIEKCKAFWKLIGWSNLHVFVCFEFAKRIQNFFENIKNK